ncbi:hypothetical protein A2U01_0089361, partial [Trifolium medium]|nr:hypothetical protein [Trifolium medium]
RDKARVRADELGQKLTELEVSHEAYKEKYALQVSLISDLQASEEKVVNLTKERDALTLVEKSLKERIAELEEKLKSHAE